MTVGEFVAKWRDVQLTERAAAQSHFLDLCALVGHPAPTAMDPTGETFCFEKGVEKRGGRDGALSANRSEGCGVCRQAGEADLNKPL